MSADSDQNEVLCERCGERPAIIHKTEYSGETTQTTDLCQTCWEKSASPEELARHTQVQQIVQSGKCKYCGDLAVGGCASGWASTDSTTQQVELWCEPCRKDFDEFTSRPENVLPESSDDKSGPAPDPMASIVADAEAYVRERAARRKAGH